MPRLKRANETQKLTLTVTTELRKRMDSLQVRVEAESLGDLLRRSVALYEYVVNEREAGNRFVVKSNDGSEREIVVL